MTLGNASVKSPGLIALRMRSFTAFRMTLRGLGWDSGGHDARR